MNSKRETRCPPPRTSASRKPATRVLYAMRNGFLYCSVDGVNWTFKSERPAAALSIAEGMTVTVLHQASRRSAPNS